MGRTKSAAEVANKWASAMASAQAAYKEGVASVTESPTEKAAQKKDKWLQGVQDSHSSGSFEQGLRAVSLQSWQQSASERGAARLSSGASGAKGKMQTFLTQFLPALDSAKQQVNSMPDTTYEERKAKSAAMQDALHALKGRLN